jgi:sulfur-carrier protein adenylyltransferase/sulfurtransferase
MNENAETPDHEGPTRREAAIPEISPTELRDRLEAEHPPLLLDVREPFEREIADLPDVGQLRIPIREVAERMEELDPDAEWVVYCRTGMRSRWVIGQLQGMGFERIHNLAGGVMGWREEVDPTLQEY